jgi:hypothetical protein
MDHREMPDERKQCCAHYECQVHQNPHAKHAALQIARTVMTIVSTTKPQRADRG